jgi:hypothetical protein
MLYMIPEHVQFIYVIGFDADLAFFIRCIHDPVVFFLGLHNPSFTTPSALYLPDDSRPLRRASIMSL